MREQESLSLNPVLKFLLTRHKEKLLDLPGCLEASRKVELIDCLLGIQEVCYVR